MIIIPDKQTYIDINPDISSIKYPILINKEDVNNIIKNKTNYIGPGLDSKIRYGDLAVTDPFTENNTKVIKINKDSFYKIEKVIKKKKEKYEITYLPEYDEFMKEARKPWINPETGELYCELKEGIYKFTLKRLTPEEREEYNKLKSRSQKLNWAMEHNKISKFYYGQLPTSGEGIITGQMDERQLTAEEEMDSKYMKVLKTNGDINNPRHLFNAKTFNVGDMEAKLLNNATKLVMIVIDKILESGDKSAKYELTNIYLRAENSYKKGNLSEEDLKNYYFNCKTRFEEKYKTNFDDEIYITKNSLLNKNIKLKFNPIKLDYEFIEKFNNEIDKIIEQSGKYVSELKKKIEYLKFADGEDLTSSKYYKIKNTLVKNYLHSPKTLSMIVLDIDLPNNNVGRIYLHILLELLGEFKSYFVKNTLKYKGEEGSLHGTVYIPLGGRYKREDVDFVAKFFKLIGLNDLNHKYYVGKCPFNQNDLFDTFKSTSNRYIFDTMKDPNSILYKLIYSVLSSHYAIEEIGLNLSDDGIKTFNGVILDIKTGINNCYDKIGLLKNLNKEQRLFFFLDNYNVIKEIILKNNKVKTINKVICIINGNKKELELDENNKIISYHKDNGKELYYNNEKIDKIISVSGKRIDDSNEIFTDLSYFGRLKSLGFNIKFKYKEDNLMSATNFIEVVDMRTETNKSKKEKEKLNNVNYKEITEFIKSLNGKCKKRTIKDLEEFKVELNSERRVNIYWFACLCGSCRKLKIKEYELIELILNNWKIRDDDKKYTENDIKYEIQRGYKNGKKYYKENVNNKYNECAIYKSSLNKKAKALLKDLDIGFKCLYNKESKKALNHQLRVRRKSNPNKELITNLYDNNFEYNIDLFKNYLEEGVDFSWLDKTERKTINKIISDLCVMIITKMIGYRLRLNEQKIKELKLKEKKERKVKINGQIKNRKWKNPIIYLSKSLPILKLSLSLTLCLNQNQNPELAESF